MPVTLNQNLDIQFHEPFEAHQPLPAIDIRIGGCEVAAHEGVARKQHLLLGIVKNDVIVRVAGCGDHLQAAGVGIDVHAQRIVRSHQVRRLADYSGAYPRKLLKWPQELGGHFRNVDRSAGKFGQPIKISNVFFVGMGGYDLRDFRLQSLKVAGKRAAHLGRARINCNSIVEYGSEEFTEQERNHVG